MRLWRDPRIIEERPIPTSVGEINWRKNDGQPGWLNYWDLKKKFRDIVDHYRPDIIHAGPIQRVGLVPALANVHPLLSMSWGFDMLQDASRNAFWGWVTSFVLKKSDWLLADCHTVKKKFISYGFPENRITVFPWGVDLDMFNPHQSGFIRRQVGYEGDLLIIHTRSWEPRYGVDIALKGFSLAYQQCNNMRMFMLGGGSQEKFVKDFVTEKGLEDRVLFCGYKKNQSLADYYRAGDVYLSASHIDGSSVALMEAMACGCPPLVSDIPSNLEWVEDGRQGWVFQDGNAEGLALKIVQIAKNREKIAAQAKQARMKAVRDADWKKNFQRLLETYETIR